VKRPTLILDGQTGALLEAGNFNIPVLQSAAQDFVGSPDAAVVTQGVGYGITTDWIDPVGAPSVVTTQNLPSWITNFHIVEAVTLPGTPASATDAVINPFWATETRKDNRAVCPRRPRRPSTSASSVRPPIWPP